jgi:hypothetical protein
LDKNVFHRLPHLNENITPHHTHEQHAGVRPQGRVHDLAIIITRAAPGGVQLALSVVVERERLFHFSRAPPAQNASEGGHEFRHQGDNTFRRAIKKVCVLF